MPNKRKPHSKRGRPKAGRDQYCIRMLPRAHDALLKAADEKQLPLGAWLERLALVRRQYTTENDEESDLQMLSRRFDIAVDEATELVNQLLEIVDEDPSVAVNGQAGSALRKLKEALAKFFGLLRGERLLSE